MQNIHRITHSISGIAAVLFLLGFIFISPAFAQEVGELEVSSNGFTAIAEFTRPTPCTPYTIAWGDNSEDIFEADSDICIQVLDEVKLAHTYVEPGTYTVTITMAGETDTDTVTVSKSDRSFGLDDVASVTEEWVDPSPIMADEEYSIYTITLKNGETVKVKAGGFTLDEWRIEQFRKAGYTGDVDELLAMIERDEPADPEPLTRESLIEQLIAALRELISRLSTR